jgi:hypothetical protein
MRLAVLPLGAYKPEGIMSPVRVSPREAVQAKKACEPRSTTP